MSTKNQYESKRRYIRGNRGTPDDCVYVKSAPLCGVYILNQFVNGVETPIVMNFEEVVRLQAVLGEHIEIGVAAREIESTVR